MMPYVYDLDAPEIVLKTSRQVSKSTTLAGLSLGYSVIYPFFKTMVVHPSQTHSSDFSRDRLDPFLQSPWIKQHMVNTSIMNSITNKRLLNGSRIYLRYSRREDEAYKLRGKSVDLLMFDEMQEINPAIVPVAKETMTRSDYKKTVYAGTPYRSTDPLSQLWNKSTQTEFVIKCKACSKYNILDETNITMECLICQKCKKPLEPSAASWVHGYRDKELVGFHLNALHFACFKAPWVSWNKDIIKKREDYGTGKFYTEVLGLAYDQGHAPVTEAQIRACCKDYSIGSREALLFHGNSVMGLDIGPQNSDRSYTVLTSIVYDIVRDMYKVVFAKKYKGKEADFRFIHDDVPKQFNRCRAGFLCGDYGLGEATLSELKRRITPDKIMAVLYSGTQKQDLNWNYKLPGYILNRNTVIDEFIDLIRHKKIEFPKWEEFKPFAQDIMNIYIEYDENNNKRKYKNDDPDDTLHSLVYAIVAYKIYNGMKLFMIS